MRVLHVQLFQCVHLCVLNGVQAIYFALEHVCMSLCSSTGKSYKALSLAIGSLAPAVISSWVV